MKKYIKSAITPMSEEPIAVLIHLLNNPRTPPEKQDELLDCIIARTKQLGDLDDDDDDENDSNFNDGFNYLLTLVRSRKASPDLLRKIYNQHIMVDDIFLDNQNTPDDVLEDIAAHSESFSTRMLSYWALEQKRGAK
jgi:hypothetical protein